MNMPPTTDKHQTPPVPKLSLGSAQPAAPAVESPPVISVPSVKPVEPLPSFGTEDHLLDTPAPLVSE